jgi:hypothetical protein
MSMSWVEEQFERRLNSTRQEAPEGPVEAKLEALVEGKWNELIRGLNEDVEEFRRLGGDADFDQLSSTQCRVLNATAGTSATVTVDVSAHTIQYTFAAEARDTAVPEGGFFSLRRSARSGADIYSSDQRITTEQARRMILEPLLFPAPPHIM